MGSRELDRLLRQLRPEWKNVLWAKEAGLNSTHLSRVRTGRVGLSAHVARQLASAAAPDDEKQREVLVADLLAAASAAVENPTSLQEFKNLMARLSHPNTWVCVEYRDLPRASEGGKYAEKAELVGNAIRAGLCFAMFQPFGTETGSLQKTAHLTSAVRTYLDRMIGEVRSAYAKLATAAKNAGVEEEDVRNRLILYERNDRDGPSLGFQSRLFCAKLPEKNDLEVWEWVATPGEDLFVRREIDSKAVSQQFYEIIAFFDKLKEEGKPARLPATAEELEEGRQHAKTAMWPDLEPRPTWEVSKFCARRTASHAGKRAK